VKSKSRLSILRKNEMPGLLFHSLRLKALFRGSPGLIHYLFAFVFLVRLIVLMRLASSPFLLPSGSDMHFYDDWAKQIVHGRFTDHQAFYGLPLYPFLVALLYSIFGASPFVPAFFQAVLDAGTAVLIYKIAIRVLDGGPFATGRASRFSGIIAAVGWCFFVPAQAYSAILMPTAAAVFMFWLLVWQLVRTENAPSLLCCAVYGFLIGVTAMAVATILFLIPLFLWAIFMRQQGQSRLPAAGAAAAALLFLGILAGTSPCWIHNYVVARDPVLLSAHGGINLWLGNNPDATGYPRFPGLHAGQSEMLRDSIDQAEVAAGRALKRSEVSRYWSAKACAYVARNPMGWLKLTVRKAGNFWNAFEYDDLGIIANLLGHRILFPGPNFGVVAALAIPGLLFSLRRSTTARWIAAAILLHLAAILPVFVTERYRLAVVPGLLVLAVVGLTGLWNDLSLGRYRHVAIYSLALAGTLGVVTIPRSDPALWAMRPYDAGREALSSGDFSRAEEQLARARAYVPENAEINLALGNLRLAQGNRPAALTFYSAVLRIDPAHKSALNNLGVMALEDARFAEAREYFLKALKQGRGTAKSYYLLARADLALGNTEEAKAAIENALKREPAQPEYRQLQLEIQQHGH
jgi:tetratricopeptide (TPR) repeat protein